MDETRTAAADDPKVLSVAYSTGMLTLNLDKWLPVGRVYYLDRVLNLIAQDYTRDAAAQFDKVTGYLRGAIAEVDAHLSSDEVKRAKALKQRAYNTKYNARKIEKYRPDEYRARMEKAEKADHEARMILGAQAYYHGLKKRLERDLSHVETKLNQMRARGLV